MTDEANGERIGAVEAWARVGSNALRSTVAVVRWSERQVLQLLDARIDAARPAPPQPLPGGGVHAEDLNTKLGRLLRQAVDQSTLAGQNELFHKLVDQLVPDEARILGALSDGSTSPTVTVIRRHRNGSGGEVVLENMALIGKTANLALAAQTPMYVSHLLALGLVEMGPHAPELSIEYEILCADPAVLRAIKAATRGPVPARVDKHTLRISALGRSLWGAASGDEPQ